MIALADIAEAVIVVAETTTEGHTIEVEANHYRVEAETSEESTTETTEKETLEIENVNSETEILETETPEIESVTTGK
ncbi:hypothetical protein QG37_06147 [Candidozyma auris]|uniref:Uncharacterized protein n=1 Tax=Candidozyma auris TaxID=498019 RepID=A0A0L0NU65_CANAR|nr:hypothetical protein QG37_06147 [[Candida] auris]